MEDKKYQNGQNYPFKALIANISKYSECDSVGTWIEFPTTYEKAQEALNRIDVGKETGYEEYYITGYDCNIENLHKFLGEHENIEELNYLARKLEEMNKTQLEKFEQIIKVVKVADNINNMEDLINLTENLDKYTYYPNITSQESLGYFYANELGHLNIPEELSPFFDYESYGKHISIREGGTFVDKGYVSGLHADVVKEYDREKGIPDEYS